MDDPLYRARIGDLADAEAALRGDRPDWTVKRLAWDLHGRAVPYLVVTRDGHDVHVSLNTDPYVAEESKEIADSYAERAYAAKVAAADRRFEIVFEMREDMDNFNTVAFVQHSLRDLLGRDCITFMASAEEFIDE